MLHPINHDLLHPGARENLQQKQLVKNLKVNTNKTRVHLIERLRKYENAACNETVKNHGKMHCVNA